MKGKHRHWRAVRRGRMNPATFDVRNRKAEREFDRWFNGRHVQETDMGWLILPTGRGLIHKGRKP
jgi:hypothetical protein